MAITSYPFDNQSTTETQFSQLFRELQDSGIADSISGDGFIVSADSTGMVVSVKPGFALVRGHAVLSTVSEQLTIAAAGSQARVDAAVLRLDPSLNKISLEVITGTPGSGAPALIQTSSGIYELLLANVAVDAGVVSLAPATVTGLRPFLGSRVGSWRTETRPKAPRKGQLGLNDSSGQWEYWHGAAWVDLAPATVWSNISGKPNTFTPSTHSHGWNEVTGKPSSYQPSYHQHSFAALNDKPSAYPSEAHGHGSLYYDKVQIYNYLNERDQRLDALENSRVRAEGDTSTAPNANGSRRPHSYAASGAGPWYSVWVDASRNFCRNTSSIRFKKNVRHAEVTAGDVLALTPRTYDRKDSEDGTPGRRDEFGLIAEEVYETLPEIVVINEDGEIDSVRYDLLAAALLPVVKNQQARIERLESAVEELLAR